MNVTPSTIVITEASFARIAGFLKRAAAGDDEAGRILGELPDATFEAFLQARRERRKANELEEILPGSPMPSYPAGTGSAGSSGNGNLDGDPAPVRGQQRILLAMTR